MATDAEHQKAPETGREAPAQSMPETLTKPGETETAACDRLTNECYQRGDTCVKEATTKVEARRDGQK